MANTCRSLGLFCLLAASLGFGRVGRVDVGWLGVALWLMGDLWNAQ